MEFNMNRQKQIIKFCNLVNFINHKSAYLQKEKENFYDGGHPFEECYYSDVSELNKACNDMEHLLKIIIK